jgi:class 3 adenylate cyclase
MADQWNFFADQRIGIALSTEYQSNTKSERSRLCWVGAMSIGERNRAERRLAAILAADVPGYSRLIGADEEGDTFGDRAMSPPGAKRWPSRAAFVYRRLEAL